MTESFLLPIVTTLHSPSSHFPGKHSALTASTFLAAVSTLCIFPLLTLSSFVGGKNPNLVCCQFPTTWAQPCCDSRFKLKDAMSVLASCIEVPPHPSFTHHLSSLSFPRNCFLNLLCQAKMMACFPQAVPQVILMRTVLWPHPCFKYKLSL